MLNIIQVALDALALLIAYTGAIVFKLNVTGFVGFGLVYYWGALWMIPLLLLVYYFMNVYSPMRTSLFRREVLILAKAHFFGVVTIYSVLFLNKEFLYSREVSLVFAVTGFLLIVAQRYFIRKTLRYLRKKGYSDLLIGKALHEFKKMAKEKAVSEKTIVFNNLVNNKGEYLEHWEVPASESWHARFM